VELARAIPARLSKRRDLLLRAATLAFLALAAFTAVQQVHRALANTGKGIDFRPLSIAVTALTHGSTIYADRLFVYPPTAAVALLPLSAGGYSADLTAWIVLSTIAVALAALLSMAPWRGAVWVFWSSVALFALLKSDALTSTLPLGNLGLLLAPLGVGVLLLYESGRWRTGSWLLVASLLLKPLLVPLILLPLLRGRWRELVAPLVAGCLLLGLAIAFVPGAAHFGAVLRFIGGGSNLTGSQAVYNISFAGLFDRLHQTAWVWPTRVLVVGVAIALTLRWLRAPARAGGLAAEGTVLFSATLLAAPISEEHYLLVLMPCLLAAVALAEPRRETIVLMLLALVLLAYPEQYAGNIAQSWQAVQVRFLLAEVAILAAAAAAILGPARAEPAAAVATSPSPS
jgi:arabinofuranan 3-O-arabinosyltransferase